MFTPSTENLIYIENIIYIEGIDGGGWEMFEVQKKTKNGWELVTEKELRGAIFVRKYISPDGYVVMEFRRGKTEYRVWIG